MAMFKNTQGITKIIFSPKKECHNICPLGQEYINKITPRGKEPVPAHYTNHFTIELSCSNLVPDYCDIEEWIDNNLLNQTLIIEDCVNMLYNYINTTYKPLTLKVTSKVVDAVHGPVEVVKEKTTEKIINL